MIQMKSKEAQPVIASEVSTSQRFEVEQHHFLVRKVYCMHGWKKIVGTLALNTSQIRSAKRAYHLRQENHSRAFGFFLTIVWLKMFTGCMSGKDQVLECYKEEE